MNKENASETIERIRIELGFENDSELCRKLKINRQALSNWKNRNTIPFSFFVKIAELKKWSLDWLMFGEGVPERKKPVYQNGKPTTVGSFTKRPEGQHAVNIESHKKKPPTVGGFDEPDPLKKPPSIYPQKTLPQTPKPSIIYTSGMSGEESDCSLGLVPMVQARLSAGHGSFEAESNIDSWFAFRMEFLRQKGQPNQMVLMRVAGSSMSPNIKNGDMVLIDQSQKDIRPGQVYAVGVEDLIYLKLIDTRPGVLVLRSINAKEHPPIEVPITDSSARQVPILGRCIWSCHEW